MRRRPFELPGQFGTDRFGASIVSRNAPRRRVSLFFGEFLLVTIVVLGFIVLTSAIFSEPSAPLDKVALKGHTQGVEALAFSPDGRTLASCGWDNSVRLWDLSGMNGGVPVAEPIVLPHDSVRYAVAFSPDGKRLVCGGDHSLTIWSCKSPGYELVARREGPTYRCAAFSPDGQTLALGCDDGTVLLLDGETADEWAVLRGHGDAVRSLAFSPDGAFLVSSGQDRQITLWDAIEGKRVRSLGRPGLNPVQLVAFSPRGDQIAVGEICGNPQEVILIDPLTGDPRSRLDGHSMGVNALTFSPDGKMLATAGGDRTIKFWDLKDGKQRGTLDVGVGFVHSISFSPDGKWLAYPGNDLTIRLWNMANEQTLLVGRAPLKAS
jgi:WD40 repeat protein